MKLPGSLIRIKPGIYCVGLWYLGQKFWKQLSHTQKAEWCCDTCCLAVLWEVLLVCVCEPPGEPYERAALWQGSKTFWRCLQNIRPAGNGRECAGGWRKCSRLSTLLKKRGSLSCAKASPDCQQCQQTLAVAICWIQLSFTLCLCLTITKQFGFFNLAFEPEQELNTALWSNFYLHSSWLD